MFERFTEAARETVGLAQDEACELRHACVGTEHLLLGLLRIRDSPAAIALGSLDITVERVRPRVSRLIGTGEDPLAGQNPFTPRAKKVLELSFREALILGHPQIGTEHLLLGIMREHEGVAARVLMDCGAESETVRELVLTAITDPDAVPERREPEFSLAFEDVRATLSCGTRAVFMAAAARALDDGRVDIEIEDVLLALVRHPSAPELLAELGVQEAAVRQAIDRRHARPHGSEDPPATPQSD